MPTENAGFKLRILAALNDWLILFLPHNLFLAYLSTSANLPTLIINIFLYLIIILFPLMLISPLFYYAFLTSKIGYTVGKAVTGLTVVDENGHNLSYKRSFFRHTTGYTISSLLLWLGFLTIIKDPNKQGWHDKAVGSKVIVRRNLWQLSVIILIILTIVNISLLGTSINRIISGNLPDEIFELINSKSNKEPIFSQTI